MVTEIKKKINIMTTSTTVLIINDNDSKIPW